MRSRFLTSLWWVGLWVLGLQAVPAWAQARHLRVCMTDTPHIPWRQAILPGQVSPRGLDYELLDAFERQSGWRVVRLPMASRRCLVELQMGRVDATIGLSYTEDRSAYLRFPMKGGQPDASLALRQDGYSLYFLGDGGVRWDGRQIQLPAGGVLEAPAGHSIAQQLRARGHTVGERSRHTVELLRWVADGEIAAAALHTSEAEAQRSMDPRFAKIQRGEPALVVKPYFVAFSNEFARHNEAALPGLWRGFLQASRFPAYQQAAQTGQAPPR